MVARGEMARFWSLESLHMGRCADAFWEVVDEMGMIWDVGPADVLHMDVHCRR